MAFGASAAARWQATQTRARMGASLWWLLIKCAAFAWLLCSVFVVWHETGQAFPGLRHAYFWRWMLGGIFTGVPLLDRLAPYMVLPMNGGWYALPEVTGWLNDPRFYHGTFGQWFWHYARYTTLVPLALGIFAVSIRMCRDGDAEHLRGLRLLRPRRHNHQLNGGWRGKIRRGIHRVIYIDSPGWAPVRLGSTIIPHDKECEHFLVTGSPGAGKSTLIRQMLLQLEQRGQTAIVIDPECEFVRQFYDERRGDIVLNPLDARCPFWSPWLELRDDSFAMDAEALAASLIRGQPRNSSAQFFQESSRTLVESIFQLLKGEQEPRGIATFLAQPRNEIHQALAGTRAYPLVDPQAHEQGAGILATAANAVKPFHHLPAAGQTARPWSAREWAQTRKGWVFLCSTEDARAAIQKLQGVWLDSLVRWLMSADIGSDQVWIIADELASLEYQPQIEKLVTRGRKRGMATVLGFQNVSQLRSIYGRSPFTQNFVSYHVHLIHPQDPRPPAL